MILQAARPRTSWSFKNGWPTSPPRICNAVPASNTARRQSMHPCSRHTASLKILWNFSERSERGGNPQVSAFFWFWRIEMSERIWAFGDFSKIQFCFHFHKSDLHILFQTPRPFPPNPPPTSMGPFPPKIEDEFPSWILWIKTRVASLRRDHHAHS